MSLATLDGSQTRFGRKEFVHAVSVARPPSFVRFPNVSRPKSASRVTIPVGTERGRVDLEGTDQALDQRVVVLLDILCHSVNPTVLCG